MANVSCLAGIDREDIPSIVAALKTAGAPSRSIVTRLSVTELQRISPAILVCDIDGLVTDSLELLRQIRFTLPLCVIIVYTMELHRAWSVSCHLAGASGTIIKNSSAEQLVVGIRGTIQTACFTDPRFAKV